MISFDKEFSASLKNLAVPIMLQSLLSTAIGTADTLMLSAVGQTELSAVSLANQWSFILNLFFTGLVGGTGIMLAQYMESKKKEQLPHVFGMALWAAAAVCILFGGLAFLFPEGIMGILTDDDLLIRTGCRYLQIVGFSYLFMAFTQPYLVLLKTLKHPGKSTAISTAALVINLIFNAVFIFGLLGAPKMGVAGVALATLLSRAAEFLFCAIDLSRCRYIRIDLRPGHGLWKTFAHISLPLTVQGLVWGGGMSAMTALMGHMSSDVVAANSVASSIQSIARVASIGLAVAGAILLGNDLGKNAFPEAQAHSRQLTVTALIAGICGCILMLLSVWPVTRLLSLTDTARYYLTVMYCILAVNVIFAAITYCMLCGVFVAGGDTRFGMFLDGITMWSLIAAGYLAFRLDFPPLLIFLILKLDECIKTPIVLLRYRRGKWVKNITEQTS